jgi:hypothetical protein
LDGCASAPADGVESARFRLLSLSSTDVELDVDAIAIRIQLLPVI